MSYRCYMISHLGHLPMETSVLRIPRLFVAPNAVLLWVTGVAHLLLRQRLVRKGWIRCVDFSASQARQPFLVTWLVVRRGLAGLR